MQVSAVQIGTQDYLVKGKLQPELLSRQVRYAILRQKSQSESAGIASQPPSPVRVIGRIGAKGGVGTSTIACDSSLELKRQGRQRVYWWTSTSTVPKTWRSLAAPAYSEEQIHSDRIRYVLRFLRSQYPWIVLGRLNQFSTSLPSDLTDLLLATTFDLAAVTETQHVVRRLAEIGFESRRAPSSSMGFPKWIVWPRAKCPRFWEF